MTARSTVATTVLEQARWNAKQPWRGCPNTARDSIGGRAMAARSTVATTALDQARENTRQRW
eukprot:11165143-Alexandrium_andersonii.AAC.1